MSDDTEVRDVTRPWRPLDRAALKNVPVNTGVFALREQTSGAVRLFVAGARSRRGLRGELEGALEESRAVALDFTYLSTNNYLTLYREWRDFPQRFDPENPFIRADGVTVAQRGPR